MPRSVPTYSGIVALDPPAPPAGRPLLSRSASSGPSSPAALIAALASLASPAEREEMRTPDLVRRAGNEMEGLRRCC